MDEIVLDDDITKQRSAGKSIMKYNNNLEALSQELRTINEQLMSTEEELRHQLNESERNNSALIDVLQQRELLFGFLPDPAFAIDERGQVTVWNQAMEELTGITSGEMLGKSNFEYAIPFYGKRRPLIIDLVLSGTDGAKEYFKSISFNNDTIFTEEYFPQLGAKGTYLSSKSSPLLDRNKRIIGAVQIMRDISELKAKEEAMQQNEKKLQKKVKYLKTLINNLNVFFITYDLNGCITYANKRSYELLGYTQAEMSDRRIVDLIVENHRPLVLQGMQDRLNDGMEGSYELSLIHKEGHTKIIKLNAAPIMDEKGIITGGMVLIEDITERKRMERQLRFSEARYRAIVEDQTELICRFIPNGEITFANMNFCRYLNRDKSMVYGTDFMDIVYEDDKEIVRQCVNSLSTKSPVKAIEHRVQIPDGTIRWQYWTHRAIFNDYGKLIDYQSVGTDITERKLAEDKLKFLSRHDKLTGLFNRFHFEEQMKYYEHSQCIPLGLIMCDVDGLKLINDILGHDKGDELLKAAAHVIAQSFRKNDIVARVGGDEFAILLPNSKQHVIKNAVARIKRNINLYNKEHPRIPLSIAIGYAVRYDTNVSIFNLYQEADNNMYREKLHSGQNVRSLIVHTLMKALEARDYITEGHTDRMQNLVENMGRSLNLTNQKINDLKLLAQFHDIGKVGVPDSILFKPGLLNFEEYTVMKRHSDIGNRIALYAPELMLIADWILKHHEWWDGNGYPLGLSGEAIPLECRILAVTDAYDSMTNDRPYRKAMSHQQAINELLKNAGRQFDPVLVSHFVVKVEEWRYNDSGL